MTTELYTDGACSHDRRGGWAWILVHDGRPIAGDLGGEHETTNNRMEIEAVLRGLLWLPRGEQVVVVSDSAYVVNCFRQKWYERWERNGWRTSGKKDVANADLWRQLIAELRARPEGSVSFRHTRGHNGDHWNESCDKLAVHARLNIA